MHNRQEEEKGMKKQSGTCFLKGKRFLLLSMTLFALSIMFFAYAFTVTWNAPTAVTVYAASLDLKVYWDSACTNATTSINFGNVQKSTQKSVTLYVRNEGNGTVIAYWNSTCPSVTSDITETWTTSGGFNLNGYTMAMGTLVTTYYRITVAANCSSGPYSWTLDLGAQPV